MYCKVMAALIGPGFYKIKKRCSSSFISLLKPLHFKWAKYLDHGHVFCSCDAVMVWTCPDITVTVMVMNIVPILYYCLSPDPASCCWPLNATYTILTRYLLCFANMTHSDTA